MAKCRCRKSFKDFKHKDVVFDEDSKLLINQALKELRSEKKNCFDCDIGNCCFVNKIDKYCHLCVIHHLTTKENNNGYCYKRPSWE